MAPEQAMAQEIGPWTDLYAVGVHGLRAADRCVPFQADGTPMAMLMQHISDPIPDLPAGTNPELAAWVKEMMAKDPSGRPRGARAAGNQLEEIIIDVAGPLWRREAPIGEHEPTVERPAAHPRALLLVAGLRPRADPGPGYARTSAAGAVQRRFIRRVRAGRSSRR